MPGLLPSKSEIMPLESGVHLHGAIILFSSGQVNGCRIIAARSRSCASRPRTGDPLACQVGPDVERGSAEMLARVED